MRPGLLTFYLGTVVFASVACQRTPTPPVAKPANLPATVPAPVTPVTPVQPGLAIEPTTKPGEEPLDWVLPGSLGPLTTRLQLEARFDKANIREETFDGAEGIGTYQALVVFPDNSRKRLELVQDADNPDAPIVELRVRSPDSEWHDANGLRPGMTLAELVALNGAPVSFYGLAWDYGGTVQDWHGGKLANPVDAKVFHRVSLAAREGAGEARLPQGDASFRSDDTRYPTIGSDLMVGQLGISWPNDAD